MYKFLLLIFVYFYIVIAISRPIYLSISSAIHFISLFIFSFLFIFRIISFFSVLYSVYYNSFFHLDISYYLSRVYVILCILYMYTFCTVLYLYLYNSLSLSISLPPYIFGCLPFSSCSYLSHLCCSHAARHCSSSNFSLLKFRWLVE